MLRKIPLAVRGSCFSSRCNSRRPPDSQRLAFVARAVGERERRDKGAIPSSSAPTSISGAPSCRAEVVPRRSCSTRMIYLTSPADGKDSLLCYDRRQREMADGLRRGKSRQASQRLRQQRLAGHRRQGDLRLLQERHVRGRRTRRQGALEDEPRRAIRPRHVVLGSRHLARADREARRHGAHASRRVVAGGVRQSDGRNGLEGRPQLLRRRSNAITATRRRWSSSIRGRNRSWSGAPSISRFTTQPTAQVTWSCGNFNPDAQQALAGDRDAGHRRRHGGHRLRSQRSRHSAAVRHSTDRQRRRHRRRITSGSATTSARSFRRRSFTRAA